MGQHPAILATWEYWGRFLPLYSSGSSLMPVPGERSDTTRILTSYEKVLTWATSIGDLQDHQTSTGVKIRMLESPPFPTEISSSGESESEHEQFLKDTSRKRSISIRDLQDQANIEMSESTLSCAESLGQSRHQQHSFKKRVKTGVGLVDLHQDNHTWRIYGQKITGYFKCVDRRGCSGRKQVQQADKDPTKFRIKYKGKHTYTQASHNNNVSPSPSSAEQRQQSQVDTTLSSSYASISVVTQDYKDNPRQQTFSSFHLASSSSDVTHSFVSPEISETSYLSVAEAVDDSICPNLHPEIGLEGPLDDGFSWRKYGQKDILGAKFPRGYYRCTHRNIQGCLASKQVQRSDEDPTMFEITYQGRHTCTQFSSNIVPSNFKRFQT